MTRNRIQKELTEEQHILNGLVELHKRYQTNAEKYIASFGEDEYSRHQKEIFDIIKKHEKRFLKLNQKLNRKIFL